VQVDALYRYPVKSCRGEALTAATVEPWGLAGDRRWQLVDAAGDCLTAREFPRLLLITPELLPGGGLRFAYPGAPHLVVEPPNGTPVEIRVHDDELIGTPAAPAAHRWFTEILGMDARLVHQHDPTSRPTSPFFTEPGDVVSLADAYPLLLVTMASLDALNDLIAAGQRADEGPLSIRRFRPNVVVKGGRPWAEDGWRRVRVGEAVFRAVKGCDRCVLTTTDPDTAARGKEPIATLARHRRWDGKTWFGMNLVPDTPGATIRVGDAVEILENVEAPDGPPR
jgi:uncharacterized protein YcbX